jgi:hypothetical protein
MEGAILTCSNYKNKMHTAPEGSTSLASLIASDVAIS